MAGARRANGGHLFLRRVRLGRIRHVLNIMLENILGVLVPYEGGNVQEHYIISDYALRDSCDGLRLGQGLANGLVDERLQTGLFPVIQLFDNVSLGHESCG